MTGGRPHVLRLADRRWLAPDILELRWTRPPDFGFIPGQYLRFLMDGYQRDYTLINAAASKTLDICVALVRDGRFSRDVVNLAIGDPMTASGPHGHFIFRADGHPPVFVATGTGVAPFVAFSRAGISGALLLHGVSTPDRLIYADPLDSLLRTYVPCISRSITAGTPSSVFPGRVTGYLDHRLADGKYDFYLCGRRAMIRDATAVIDNRFGDSRLFVETFD
jgi:ferredoxin-NADP reductase